jgi:phosphoserine phosphatase
VLGAPLRASAVAAIAGRVADTGANIDRIVRVAAYPVTAIELEVSGAPTATLRAIVRRRGGRRARRRGGAESRAAAPR